MLRLSPYKVGVLFGLINAACSALIAIILSTHKGIATNWILVIQSFMAFLFCCIHGYFGAFFKKDPQSKILTIKTDRYPKHLLRGLAGLGIYIFYYSSLKFSPKVDCSLLLNTAPLFVPIFCLIGFKETISLKLIIGILVGFIGLAFTLHPEIPYHGVQVGHLLALLAGICFALSMVIVRDLNRTESVATTLLYYNFHSFLAMSAYTFWYWSIPSWADIRICLLVGAIFSFMIFAIHVCVKKASALAATIVNFAAIPMLAIYQVCIGHEVLSNTTLFGIILVVSSSIIVLKLSSQKADTAKPEIKTISRIDSVKGMRIEPI